MDKKMRFLCKNSDVYIYGLLILVKGNLTKVWIENKIFFFIYIPFPTFLPISLRYPNENKFLLDFSRGSKMKNSQMRF